jgi:hypothetical protein
MAYESCVIDATGKCTRWNHDHEPPGPAHYRPEEAPMPEITEADRELADQLAGTAIQAIRAERIARALAEQREQLTRVDLYDDPGTPDISYGSPDGIGGWDVPGLIAYTLTLPTGHVIRLAPWQLRSLATEIHAHEGD